MMPISELSVLHGIRMQLDALIAEKEAGSRGVSELWCAGREASELEHDG
jgi:hypothetical protein